MYVYISEDLKGISNFTNANLIWEQGGLVYGDWYAGPDGDGTYVYSTDVEVSKVLLLSFFRCLLTFLPPSSSSSWSLSLPLLHFVAFVGLDSIITTAKNYTACLLALRVLSSLRIIVFIKKRRSHIFALKNSVNKVDYLFFKIIFYNSFGYKYFFYLVFFLSSEFKTMVPYIFIHILYQKAFHRIPQKNICTQNPSHFTPPR